MEWTTYEKSFLGKIEIPMDWYYNELSKIRTGRITASILDNIRVDAYDQMQKINQIANISSPEPRVLIIKAYDSSLYKKIAAAISTQALNMNPQVDADKIRLTFPPLTEEIRIELTKKAKTISEEMKIKIRRIRQDIHDSFRKDSELSDDDKKWYTTNLDKLTKDTNEKVDAILESKNKEILTI